MLYLLMKEKFIDEKDHDKSFRTSSPLSFMVSNSQSSNIDMCNIPNINDVSRYSNMRDDDNECNNSISSNDDVLHVRCI